MPTIFAHFHLGELGAPKLTPSQQALIAKHRDCYDFAQQGPDFFFYYLLRKNKAPAEFGMWIHHQTFASFLEKVHQRHARMPLSEPARAFLYGFAGHFTLDAHAHPYVNKIDQRQARVHYHIETQFDEYLLKGLGRIPHRFNLKDCLPATRTVQAAAAEVFEPWTPDQVTAKQIKQAVRWMSMLRGLMFTPTLRRARFIEFMMKKLGMWENHGVMLMLPDPPVPTTEEAEQSTKLHTLHQQAVQKFPEVLEGVDRALEYGDIDPWFERDFE